MSSFCCRAGHWTYWARQELEGHWHLPAGHSGGALPYWTLYCAAVKRQVFLQTHLHIGIENVNSFSSVLHKLVPERMTELKDFVCI